MSQRLGTYVHPSTGDVSTGTLTNFKNKLINGAMQISQRGVGGASTDASPLNYTLDRWACATAPGSGTLAAGQVALSAADRAATGQINAAAVGPAPTVGLVAYFPFDGGLTDASGNGVVLSVTGGVSYVPGRVGSSAVYLANEGNLAAASAAANYMTIAIQLPYSFTISCWVLTTANNNIAQQFIWNTTNASTLQSNNLNVSFGGSSTTIGASVQNVNNIGTAYTAAKNTWYHIVVTYNGTAAVSYFNGAFNGSVTASITSGTYIIIGNSGTSGAQPFAGFIDDFRIYNRVLSAGEIAALANLAPVGAAPATTLASGLTTWLTFDNTTADAQGTLAAPTGTPVFSSASKSGTACLDCTGNVVGTSETTSLNYSISVSLPLSVSCWFNASSTNTAWQIIWCIGSSSTWAFGPVILSNNLYVDAFVSGTNYHSPSSNTPVPLSPNTWYHACSTLSPSGYHLLYINGLQVFSRSVGTGTTLTANNGAAVTNLKIGGQLGSTGTAFKGLIDDVRIYNRALSPQEVAGLYYSYQPAPYALFQQPVEGLNVADLGWGTPGAQPAAVSCWLKNNTASAQQFSLSLNNASVVAPRSYLYTTPSIAPNTWQYVKFTVPGDTTDAAWATDTTCGVNLALCLGAGGPYVSATTSGWASAKQLTGAAVQAWGGSSTNFLAGAGNSVLVTGVQLEKGAVATPFDVRPSAVELQLCMRYFERLYNNGSVVIGSFQYIGSGVNDAQFPGYLTHTFKVSKRAIPSIYENTSYADQYIKRVNQDNVLYNGVQSNGASFWGLYLTDIQVNAEI